MPCHAIKLLALGGRVAVKHGWIFRATAGEIIPQTEHSVDLQPTVTQKEK